jgi:hypothetical protein
MAKDHGTRVSILRELFPPSIEQIKNNNKIIAHQLHQWKNENIQQEKTRIHFLDDVVFLSILKWARCSGDNKVVLHLSYPTCHITQN